MWFYSVLLLSCLLFASTAAGAPCDSSLIATEDRSYYNKFKIHYENVTKSYQCIYDDEDDFDWRHTKFTSMIRFESMNYDYIKCTEEGGWIGLRPISHETGKISMNETKLVDATSSIFLTCRRVCQIDIAKRYEKQDRLTFDKLTRIVTCQSSGNSLLALQKKESNIMHTSLRCDDIESEWFSGKENVDSSTLYNFFCRDYCEWTGDDLKVEKFEKGSENHHVKIGCVDNSQNLYFAGVKIESKEAKCSLTEGWSSNNVSLFARKYKYAYEHINIPPHFECRKDPPACAIQLSKGNQNIFEELSIDLKSKKDEPDYITCVDTKNALRSIAFNSQKYERLRCDKEEGWMSRIWGRGEKKIADAASPLIISCEEYCAVAGTQISQKIEKGYFGKEIEASCENRGVYENMVHNGEIVVDKHNALECSLSNGWTKKYNYGGEWNNTGFETIKLECEPNPCSYLDKGASGLKNGEPLRCENDFTAIEFKSKRYTSLTCDNEKGWKDGNITIAEPSIPLDYNCVPYCRASGNAQVRAEGKVNVVACDDSSNELIHARKHLVENRVECSFDKGWSFIKGSVDIEQQEFECRQAPLPCVFEEKSVDLLKSEFDHKTNKTILACQNANNARHEIEFLSNRYTSLECDETNGWKAGNKTIANVVSRMIVKCVSAEHQPKTARKM